MLNDVQNAQEIDDVLPRLGMIVGILCNTMNSSMSLVQKLISSMMMSAQAPTKVMTVLNGHPLSHIIK